MVDRWDEVGRGRVVGYQSRFSRLTVRERACSSGFMLTIDTVDDTRCHHHHHHHHPTMSNPPTKLSFSLSKPSSTKPPPPPSGFSFSLKKNGGPSSTSKQPSLSLDDEDDEPSSTGAANSIKRPSKETGTNKSLIAKSTGAISRAARKVQEEAVKVDSSVFEYDEVWDGMKAAQKDVEREKEAEALERKVCAGHLICNTALAKLIEVGSDSQPKYVEAFLASASTRRLDRLRAEEKMLQHERDKEGEEFEGKEKFVTGAYKKQMEEVRKAEEEEKAREGELRFQPFACLTSDRVELMLGVVTNRTRKKRKERTWNDYVLSKHV